MRSDMQRPYPLMNNPVDVSVLTICIIKSFTERGRKGTGSKYRGKALPPHSEIQFAHSQCSPQTFLASLGLCWFTELSSLTHFPPLLHLNWDHSQSDPLSLTSLALNCLPHMGYIWPNAFTCPHAIRVSLNCRLDCF